MAEENETNEDVEAATGGKKKIIFFAVLVILIIATSVGGTFIAVKMMTPEPKTIVVDEEGNPVEMAEGEGESEEMKEEEAKKPAIYYPLKPPLIVNYEARGRQRFMQAEITLMAREDDVINTIELHMPMIRNNLILLFSGHVYEELQTDEGRELLRQQALEELQKIMEKELQKPGVEKVLFTNLVMQ